MSELLIKKDFPGGFEVDLYLDEGEVDKKFFNLNSFEDLELLSFYLMAFSKKNNYEMEFYFDKSNIFVKCDEIESVGATEEIETDLEFEEEEEEELSPETQLKIDIVKNVSKYFNPREIEELNHCLFEGECILATQSSSDIVDIDFNTDPYDLHKYNFILLMKYLEVMFNIKEYEEIHSKEGHLKKLIVIHIEDLEKLELSLLKKDDRVFVLDFDRGKKISNQLNRSIDFNCVIDFTRSDGFRSFYTLPERALFKVGAQFYMSFDGSTFSYLSIYELEKLFYSDMQ